MSVIGWILFGLVVGIVGKLLTPGRDPGGFPWLRNCRRPYWRICRPVAGVLSNGGASRLLHGGHRVGYPAPAVSYASRQTYLVVPPTLPIDRH
jgi:hypothetical protein